MENKFFDAMSKLPDEQLVKIVTEQRADYQEDAVLAAEETLRHRGIPVEQPLRNKQHLSPEEVRNEIKQRLDAGEDIEAIKIDFRERNINTFDMVGEELEKEDNLHPEVNLKKSRKRYIIIRWLFIAIGIFRLGLGLSDSGNTMDRVIGIVFISGAILGFASDYLKNQKEEMEKSNSGAE